MHLTYERASRFRANELMQGDVLERTPSIDAVLKQVHPHFHDHPKNLFFTVLTQTCDLVRRGEDGTCKTAYINIAPVRSLDLLLEREVKDERQTAIQSELPVLGSKARTRLTLFMERLLNNNEPRFFYLDGADTCLPGGCVAFLQLSIPVKADLHLETCLQAKRLQLTEAFQAKLGWLLGQMFTRVATEDWDRGELTKKVRELLGDAAIWVDENKIAAVQSAYASRPVEVAGSAMSKEEISRALAQIKSRRALVLQRAADVIATVLPNDAQLATRIAKRLSGDSALSALLKD